jgi:hypothetical protein
VSIDLILSNYSRQPAELKISAMGTIGNFKIFTDKKRPNLAVGPF